MKSEPAICCFEIKVDGCFMTMRQLPKDKIITRHAKGKMTGVVFTPSQTLNCPVFIKDVKKI